jgi:hypothetical protein
VVSLEKKLVLGVFLFMVMVFMVMGFMMERNVASAREFRQDVPVQYVPLQSASNGRIQAVVKGSIYETGSNMTVFGECLDGDSYLLPGASATFSAWYPNGSVMVGPNASMSQIYDDFQGFHPNGTGRWKIDVTMGNTVGTYLTEMRCEYGSQWATALGEWQNPEWVVKIGDVYASVNGLVGAVGNVSSNLVNLSSNVNQFMVDANNNFTDVLNAINAISVNTTITESDKTQKLMEIYNAVKDSEGYSWVLDTTNPTYSMGSGVNNWVAVDMGGPNVVAAVSSDGAFQFWNGQTWTYQSFPGVEWHGVGVYDGSLQYAWLVGESAGQAVYSLNGANVTVFSENGSTVLYDVKIVKQPNIPGDFTFVYVVSDKGLFVTTNFGGSWTMLSSFSGNVTHAPRMSKIIANADNGATSGFRFLVVDDQGDLLYYNGTGIVPYASNYTFIDAAMVHDGLGYVLGLSGNASKVWRFDETNGSIGLTEVYGWRAPYEIVINLDNSTSYVLPNASSAYPVGIAAVSADDVWVATSDPSVFYHFDGFKWQYEAYRYSQSLLVTITFGNTSFVSGMHDISMSDEFNGYVVGDSGLMIRLYPHVETKLDSMLANLTAQLAGLNVSIGNFSGNMSIDTTELMQAIQSMNSSVTTMVSGLGSDISQMNASVQYKLDSIASNVTYGNIYMETTIFPVMNATYAGVQQLLVNLGILEGKMNQTIELQNQTLQIVNQTQQGVEELVNKSRRVHGWTTT